MPSGPWMTEALPPLPLPRIVQPNVWEREVDSGMMRMIFEVEMTVFCFVERNIVPFEKKSNAFFSKTTRHDPIGVSGAGPGCESPGPGQMTEPRLQAGRGEE